MGRPRLRDLTIPAHIEQSKIPTGAYWSRGDRVWYTVVYEGDKKRRRKLAGPEAKLSDLHRILEEYAGMATGTLGWLCAGYHESDKFKGLAETTRSGYESDRKVVDTYVLKSGQALGSVRVATISTPHIQRLIDSIGKTHPSKANHLLRYLGAVLSRGSDGVTAPAITPRASSKPRSGSCAARWATPPSKPCSPMRRPVRR